MPDWILREVDEQKVDELSGKLLISPLEARLLLTRGIDKPDKALKFLSPSINYLHDPFLFNEMERAVDIIHRSITERKRILIHGDYDADGICGTAILYEALSRLGADVYYFIPDRYKDGYGLARRMVERSLETGLDLLISVDCGSSDHEIISELTRGGVTVIITDHHETKIRPVDAAAFLNPKLPAERYPFQELTGSGVAFKLLQGLEKKLGISLSLSRYLDLVAIGTLGDYAAVDGENRLLVTSGIEQLTKWRRPGLDVLRNISGLQADGFSPKRICFTIVPRINSPGRMGSARDVVRLLITDDRNEAKEIAMGIEDKNIRRRAQDSVVTEEASYLADILFKRAEPNALVFSSSSWSEGVVGISAARLAEKYRVPSVLIAVREGIGKGSARSAGRVNIKEALERCSQYLIEFGGHKEAGGFSIREENIPLFQQLFEEVVGEMSEGVEVDKKIYVDAEVALDDCTLELISFIERMRPFGPGNHEPIVMLKGLRVLPESRIVGEGHLRLKVADGSGRAANLIGFSLAGMWNLNELIDSRLDFLLHLRRNHYMGKDEPQLQIVEMRFNRDGR